MKNTLLCILVLVLAFLSACKKEEIINNDPFTNGTIINNVINYEITVKNDSIIVEVHTPQTDISIEYFGDTTAVITSAFSGTAIPEKITTCYLNSSGYADSARIVPFINNVAQDFYTEYYQYDANNYLTSITDSRDTSYVEQVQYTNGNYSGTGFCEYYDYKLKLDLLSYRSYDNTITGKNDVNLRKHIGSPGMDVNYYYQFDNNGYVTSRIQANNFNSGVSYKRYNFTYTFIQ